MSELLAPAGDLEKLKYAFTYGADAVYLGGKSFSMRANAGNFTIDEIREGAQFAHDRNGKVYVTINISARNNDFTELSKYIKELDNAGVDGIIAADPGVIMTIRDTLPNMKISLSTQSSTTNYKSIEFWKRNGVNRIVLARELSFEDIKGICQNKPEGMEIETFVHGAMCISYSGRCLLSNYLTGRDANRGDCAQPCRWKYSLVESTRPGEEFPIEEHKEGSFIFNSKDLCLINHIHELIEAGVDSFKIEGRMKSIFYVSTVVNAYRNAIDAYEKDRANYKVDSSLYEELTKVSHRQYTEGFFFGKADSSSQNYGTSSYTRNYDFVAQVIGYNEEKGMYEIEQRNKFFIGDELELVIPREKSITFKIKEMYNEKGEAVESTPHPKERLFIKTDGVELKEFELIRKRL
ncbi:peptidase U32 family protein [Anaerofustis butyriciformans]|uniref:peptidase U32 family protein n=1 Tax=Anaerofustis butyriciformans TaxID=3108533 RepID=UPI003F8B491A